jgi:hypothetical protein
MKAEPNIKFSAKIKPGARVWMDFSVIIWPYRKQDKDLQFDVEYNGEHFDCKANGYGKRGNVESYGQGSLFVSNMDDFVPTPALNFISLAVFESQKNKILQQIVKKATELDTLRQSYETLLTKAPRLVT